MRQPEEFGVGDSPADTVTSGVDSLNRSITPGVDSPAKAVTSGGDSLIRSAMPGVDAPAATVMSDGTAAAEAAAPSERRRMLQFAAWQTGSFVISGVLRVLTVGLIARALLPPVFGALQYATSLAFYFYALAEFGLVALGTRRVARDPRSAGRHVADISKAKFFLASVSFLLLSGLARPLAGANWPYVLILGAAVFLGPIQIDWALRGLGRVDIVAIAEVLRSAVHLGAVALLVRTPEHAIRAVVLQVGSLAGVAISLFALLPRQLRRARESAPESSTPQVFGGPSVGTGVLATVLAAAPIAAGDLVASVYGQCDLIALHWLGEPAAVGYYAPGLRMIGPFIQLISFALLAWLPILSGLASQPKKFGEALVELQSLIAWVVVPATALGWLLAPTILRVLFGAEYAAGASSFQLLIVSLGVLAWRAPLSIAFIAAGREWNYLGVICGATVVKVVAATLLIPALGAPGAAAAAIAADVGFALGSSLWIRVVPASRLVRTWVAPLAVAGVGAVAVVLLRPLGLTAVLAGSALTYGGGAALMMRRLRSGNKPRGGADLGVV